MMIIEEIKNLVEELEKEQQNLMEQYKTNPNDTDIVVRFNKISFAVTSAYNILKSVRE